MKIELLSAEYQVKRIEEVDAPEVYVLCKSNPLYYQYCPPFITIDNCSLAQQVVNIQFVGFRISGQ